VITGGLGPTRDDPTREALAAALGQPLQPDEAAAERIRAFFREIGRPMSESNLRQALIPRGCRVLENLWGTAPGIRAQLGRAVIYVLPGVPREMREMFARSVEADVRARAKGSAVAVRVLRTYGLGESVIGERLADLMVADRNPSVGTQASEGLISVRIMGRGSSPAEAKRLVDQDAAQVRTILGDSVFGEGDEGLDAAVGRLLAGVGRTVAVAESCTGGLIAKSLTDVPGSSAYFVRGYVAYSNESKAELLGVDPAMIESHGAVSEQVAQAMAVGCRHRACSDYALSVTGIAGPSGGTPDKPVGLVYIGLADATGCTVCRMTFGGHLDRQAIRDRACKTALDFLRRRLLS
jgi:nicotinamide-nucleotide amidase